MDVTFETKHGNKAGTHDWLTPRWIIDLLGEFDLDPCFSEPRPWATAKEHFGKEEKWIHRRKKRRRCKMQFLL